MQREVTGLLLWRAPFQRSADKQAPGRERRRRVQVPRIPMPPPFAADLQLQDGKAVSRRLYDSLAAEVEQMNRAVDLLTKLPPFEEQ